MTSETPDSDDLFVEVLEHCEAALKLGQTPNPKLVARLSGKQQEALGKALVCRDLIAHHVPPGGARESEPALPKTIGRFRIERERGSGGFGVVYLARDPWAANRPVALKVPHHGPSAKAASLARLRREVQAMAKLDHPAIVPLFEAGEAGGVCFLVSAYCNGPDLAEWLKEQSAVPVRTAASWVATLADALEHAHRRGVLHRDLKPANVLMVPRTTQSNDPPGTTPDDLGLMPRLTDFGLARLREGTEAEIETQAQAGLPTVENASALTLEGTRAGTVPYMAPEQTQGRRDLIGPGADVYALGVMLYELLTGRRPFRGTTAETIHQAVNDEPIAPRRLRLAVPAALQSICLRCLEKDPARRYPSAGALAEELREWLGRRGSRTRLRSPALGLALVALLIAVGTLVLARPAGSVISEELPSSLAASDKQRLREGKPVRWAGDSIPGHRPHWVLGGGERLDRPGTFTVQSYGGLIEVCRGVPIPHFRFSAEVWHQRGSGGEAGLYFGHHKRDKEHFYGTVTFNDLAANFPPIQDGPRTCRLRMFLFRSKGEDLNTVRTPCGRAHRYPFPAGKAWRRVGVEFTESGASLLWEGEKVSEISWQFYVPEIRYLQRHEPPWPELPEQFRPEDGLGLVVRKGLAAFRNVVIEPLP